MMPLKEKTTENKVEKKQDSEALKTEEILSLLSKTRQDFIKDKEILEKIPNLFKTCKRTEWGPDAMSRSVNFIIFR